MSVLMPQNQDWLVNSWISRAFFDDALNCLSEITTLGEDIRFCVDADVDTLDLRNADRAVLQEFANLVDQVIQYRRNTGGKDFHSPEHFPTYIAKLEDLHHLAHDAIEADDDHEPTTI